MQPKKKNLRRNMIAKTLFSWIEDVAVGVSVVVIIFTFFLKVVSVDGTSMMPNYLDNDKLLVTSGYCRQGDVVIIKNIGDDTIIKRVIAVQGQTVDFDDVNSNVLVDGVPFDDAGYGIPSGVTKVAWSNYEGMEFPAVVPKGHLFVLGDNREVSKDSRYKDVGMVDVRNVVGKSFLRIYPFDGFGFTK